MSSGSVNAPKGPVRRLSEVTQGSLFGIDEISYVHAANRDHPRLAGCFWHGDLFRPASNKTSVIGPTTEKAEVQESSRIYKTSLF